MKVETSNKDRVLKCRQLQSLKRYALQINEPIFITITLNEKGIKKAPNSLFKALKRLGIDKYLLVSDYGAKNGRLHYHGLIERDLLHLFTYKGIKRSKHGHSNLIYDLSNTSFENNFGFVNVAISQDCDPIESLGYMLKYVLKNEGTYYQHKIYKHNLTKVSTLNYKCLLNFKANLDTLKENRVVIAYAVMCKEVENILRTKNDYMIETYNYWKDLPLKILSVMLSKK